jgi:hypothetical protein
VYLYFVEAGFIEKEIDKAYEASVYDAFAFMFGGYPVAELGFFQGVIPVVHAYTTDNFTFVKYTERQAFLRLQLLQRLLNELLGVLGLGGFIGPVEPGTQMLFRCGDGGEQPVHIIPLVRPQQYIFVYEYRHHRP